MQPSTPRPRTRSSGRLGRVVPDEPRHRRPDVRSFTTMMPNLADCGPGIEGSPEPRASEGCCTCTRLMRTHRECQSQHWRADGVSNLSLENGILVLQTASFPAARANKELSLTYGSLGLSDQEKGDLHITKGSPPLKLNLAEPECGVTPAGVEARRARVRQPSDTAAPRTRRTTRTRQPRAGTTRRRNSGSQCTCARWGKGAVDTYLICVGNLVVSLPARSAEKNWVFLHHLVL